MIVLSSSMTTPPHSCSHTWWAGILSCNLARQDRHRRDRRPPQPRSSSRVCEGRASAAVRGKRMLVIAGRARVTGIAPAAID